jgi:4-amino-4-deoxy-L-arabinose transferase-like glycosyltransferase
VTIALFTKAINHDGVLYITAAQEFATGNFKEGLIIFRMPFYPLLIAFTHYVVPDWIVAARLVSLSTSVMTIIPLYLLTKDFFDPDASLWACVAFALSPLPNQLAVEVIRDSAYLFFFAWTIYFALQGIESKKLSVFFLAGVSSTFAFLCRVEGIILFLCYITFLSYLTLRNSDDRGSMFKGILVYVSFPVVFLSMSSFALQAKIQHYTGNLSHFNRANYLIYRIKELISLKFLKNYHMIYNKLETFEKNLPRRPAGLNFAEIARHHMYAVYLIGVLESFIRAIFPLHVIPLGFGLKKTKIRKHAFIVFLGGCYLLLLYYFIIRQDGLRVRIFLAPAFLVYPWIGVGLHGIANYFKKGTWKWWLTIMFILMVGLVSIYGSVDVLWKQDDVVVRAGKWIKNRPELKRAEIISTDRRIPFYAGRSKGYLRYDELDYLAMEKLALDKSYDLLVIRESRKDGDKSPRLRQFKNVRKFVGVKDIVAIYYSPKLQKASGEEGES